MTPRKQMLTILEGGQPDRVPWFGDLDYWANSLIRRGLRPKDFIPSDAYIDWHREMGVGYYLQGYWPYTQLFPGCKVKRWYEGNRKYVEIGTPLGTVRDCWEYIPTSFSEAPIEHFMKSEADIPIMKYIYQNMRFEPDYALAERRWEQVGDQGIVLCYAPKSPFMNLVTQEAGIETISVCAMMMPDEFADLVETMENTLAQAAQIAIESPAEALMIPENLSSEMIGPTFFEEYVVGFQKRWTAKFREAGKYSFVHMDGTLGGLLQQQAAVGFDVLEALTPHPVGDVKIEDFESVAGDSTSIFWGGLPGAYFTERIDEAEFERHVKHVLSVMTRKPQYVLGVADQVPPDALESRVRRVAELVEEFGAYQ